MLIVGFTFLFSGVFAVSYTVDSNALYKSVSLETSVGEITKSTVKYEKYGISYSDDENNEDSLSDQPEVYELVDENYDEKITSLLNKECVQVGRRYSKNILL